MKNDSQRRITDLLAILVFGVFAICVAAVLLTGAKTYQSLTLRGSAANSRRIAVRYITTRFQQAPEIALEDFCGRQALAVREEIDGKVYLTRVYCHEGAVRELFSAEHAPVSPQDGEAVLEAEKLAFSVEDGLLTVKITHTDGTVQQLLLALPEWKEGHYEE